MVSILWVNRIDIMDWRDYEIYIERRFKRAFPEATIRHDVRLPGMMSKTSRQVDILIEQSMAGYDLSIVVDCKCFSRRIDVGQVEQFISFLADLGVSKGVMITNSGYSDAAYNRATYDSRDIDLRIINFEDLEDLQGFLAIPYAGLHCAVVSAPNGWVVDASAEGPWSCSLYPVGLVNEMEAAQVTPFAYVVISGKDKDWPDLDHLLASQKDAIHAKSPEADIAFRKTIERDDCEIHLRIVQSEELGDREDATLFLDYPQVVVFIALTTKRAEARDNIRKLEWIGEKLIKGNVLLDALGHVSSIYCKPG